MANTSSEHVADSMQALSVSDSSLSPESLSKPAPVPSPQPNPWQDISSQEQVAYPKGLHTPDPSSMDPSFNAPSPDPPLVAPSAETHPDILDEFDPLVDQKEKESREAWGQSRGHPPLPVPEPIPVPSTPEPSEKKFKRGSWALNVGISGRESPPPSASSLNSPFSSLASLARSFALPKQRPTSLDAARAVPSPATISSFANQQNREPKYAESPASSQQVGDRSVEMEAGENATALSRAKPVEQTFDFQQFLDQMKTKGAEPVAKYLRSLSIPH
jgi:Rab5 GDP/GTP exchange factor